MEKANYSFATWLRVAGMISILLCHYVQQSQNAILNMSAQFFNIGVEIFIMFCVGPVKLFGLTPYWVLDCMLVTVISVALAVTIHRVSCSISRKLR